MDPLNVIARIRDSVRAAMGDDPAHGWPHIERVRRLAWMIVSQEGLTGRIDGYVLELALLLHDVGRTLRGEGHHAVKSAEYAGKLLGEHGVPQDVIAGVQHAILAHSYSLGVRANTLEAMVLSDADKLDALGAIGIARAFHHGCLHGRGFEESVQHMVEKLLRLPDLMYLESSRRLARGRVAIIVEYIEAFRRETGLPLG